MGQTPVLTRPSARVSSPSVTFFLNHSLVFAQATLDFNFSVKYGIYIMIRCSFRICRAARAAS